MYKTKIDYPRIDYNLIEKNKLFEVREYFLKINFFVYKTIKRSKDIKNDLDVLFINLFNYINGDNSFNKKISMTVPVFVIFEKDFISMGFYLDIEDQNKIPKPNNKNLFIDKKVIRKKYFVYKTKFKDCKYLLQNRKIVIAFYSNPKNKEELDNSVVEIFSKKRNNLFLLK